MGDGVSGEHRFIVVLCHHGDMPLSRPEHGARSLIPELTPFITPMLQNHIPHQRTVTSEDLTRARQSMEPLQEAIQTWRTKLEGDCTVVAWMSDLHLHAPRSYGGDIGFYGNQVDCSFNFRLALAELATLAPLPDLLVFGGDVADFGCGCEAPTDEYAEFGRILREALPPGLPTLAISGNHDHGVPTTAAWHETWHSLAPHAWPRSPDADDYYFASQYGGWRIIGLDTREDGPLSDRQRQWLTQELARDAVTPTLVLIHRPFVRVGNWVDDIRLFDRATYDVLDASSAVKAIWSGHTHKAGGWRYRGKKHVVFPSLAYGIPGPCGWGVGMFSRNQLEAVFIKTISAPWYDGVAFKFRQSKRQVQRLPFSDYSTSPLFHPNLLPRDPR